MFSGRSERSKQVIGQAKHLIGQIPEEGNLDRFDELARTDRLLGANLVFSLVFYVPFRIRSYSCYSCTLDGTTDV